MKAMTGYSVDYYKKMVGAPCIKEFATLQEAARYLSKKYGESIEEMTKSIEDETNEDAVYFTDGHTLLFELSD